MNKATAVKSRPIIFSGPMVRAILAGRKTQTRRVVKPPRWWRGMTHYATGNVDDRGITRTNMVLCEETATHWKYCPYGVPGNHLWVRETFLPCKGSGDRHPIPIATASYVCFRDGSQKFLNGHYYQEPRRDGPMNWPSGVVWRPSIHMPRWASRITLRITEVRVERLQDITIEDVIAEGISPVTDGPHANQYWREETGAKFVDLWDSINGKRTGCSWVDSPWVWAISFERLMEAPR